ncbi:hypothetical protein [Salisediminibacterium beveridgei]|uniref:ABC transporter periplasmic binding protein yphF n=1 Tax=Salisediminibacterium beveridgei TaxID=632773 RepID=A0A1D7QUU7_9BACI|nr:hypothetical protein [Salisediminibacterium beveridgei]AOM82796.1 ABC transporter periplasmic binding protein yphF [Salisediminibacterium beveridgei]
MKKLIQLNSLIISVLILSGCLFPQDQRGAQDVPYEDQRVAVENAVHEYREVTGVLPIETREQDTPEFRRYPVNFKELNPYLSQLPVNAFENGGVYQYVILNPEEEMDVRLLDIRTSRAIQEIQRSIYQYRSDNTYAPVKEIVHEGLMQPDYNALQYDEEITVQSPFYPDHRLPVYMETDGSLIVDYRIDIMKVIEEEGADDYEPGDDLRYLLTDHHPVVPDYSYPMTMNDDGEIIFKEN